MSMQTLHVCPDHAREIILDWLIPLTEDGTMDQLMKAFAAELAPLAAAAARRALRKDLAAQDPELILSQVRELLDRVRGTLEGIALNPDMMAVCHPSWNEIATSLMDLHDWLHFLDHRPATAPQAIVHPSAEAVMAQGGLQ